MKRFVKRLIFHCSSPLYHYIWSAFIDGDNFSNWVSNGLEGVANSIFKLHYWSFNQVMQDISLVKRRKADDARLENRGMYEGGVGGKRRKQGVLSTV